MDIIIGSLIIFSLVLVAVIAPGPDLLITLRNSLGVGRRAGIMTALGIGTGIYVHVAYCVIGLAVIISQSIILFNIIKWLGAAYLIWMGVKALQSSGWKIEAEKAQNTKKTNWLSFRQGFITNALNPKATMFFLALFTQVIEPDTALVVQIWYGAICSFVAAVWFSIVSVILTYKDLRTRLAKISIWIDRMTGATFIALAARLVFVKANSS